jgi:radical SAM superfamily enzyme YgiQ (UPF0313 family)
MYDAPWKAKASYGYVKPEHFWELPLWIGEVTYALKPALDYEVELHIVEKAGEALPEADAYCFSALEVNKDMIYGFAKWLPQKPFYVGGYVDKHTFDDVCPNVKWCDSVEHLCDKLGIHYEYGVDWSLFEGTECIPRLTMSYGCSHNCKFCTVPNKVEEVMWGDIYQQVDAMKNLKFKLVYLDDKTWGMAENYHGLIDVFNHIRHFNPEFEGFIIQTSVALMQSFENRLMDEITAMQNAHIKVIELGIETFNNDLLREYRKPQREKSMTHVVKMLSEKGFKVIANIMLGLPGETKYTYFRTLGWLTMNFEHLFGVNIYTLAMYGDTPLGKEVEHDSVKDRDERSEDRTFWTCQERRDFLDMKDRFYVLGSQIWCDRR